MLVVSQERNPKYCSAPSLKCGALHCFSRKTQAGKKKTKSQRAQRAGGAVGPPLDLRVMDPNVRLCLRRLGDSCNCISQRLLFYAAAPTAQRHDHDEAESGDTGEKLVIDLGMKDDCFALAHRLFKASQVLFEAVGDVSNAAMVRCNMSSLLRSRATLEMGRYTAIASKGGDASHSVYRVHLDLSLQHVKAAQKHCDSAAASFHRSGDGTSGRAKGEVEVGGAGPQSIRKTPISNPIPKGSIRNTVALETAQTCLHLGTVPRCTVLLCTGLHYATLHDTTSSCSVPHCTSLLYNDLQSFQEDT